MKRFVFVAAIAASVAPLVAQQTVDAPRSLTAVDYARAEKFLAASTTPLVYHAAGQPTWLADERFWYRVTTEKGNEAILVDAAAATRSPCTLPECARPGGGRGRAAAGEGPTPPPRNDIPSPDGKQTAFVKDWNLWVRDVATGKETPLTTDGVKDFGYATDNAGWTKSDRPILMWAPDSRKIATFQQDQRDVGDMYLVKAEVGHPTLEAWKYPLPGDEHVAMLQRVIIDVDAARVVRLKMPPDQHRSTLCDHIACRGGELGRRRVEPGFDPSRLRVHLPRSSSGKPQGCGRRERGDP